MWAFDCTWYKTGHFSHFVWAIDCTWYKTGQCSHVCVCWITDCFYIWTINSLNMCGQMKIWRRWRWFDEVKNTLCLLCHLLFRRTQLLVIYGNTHLLVLLTIRCLLRKETQFGKVSDTLGKLLWHSRLEFFLVTLNCGFPELNSSRNSTRRNIKDLPYGNWRQRKCRAHICSASAVCTFETFCLKSKDPAI